MAASMLGKMNVLRKVGFCGNYCRVSHLRMIHKRQQTDGVTDASEDNRHETDEPPFTLIHNKKGEVQGLGTRPFPRHWSMDQEVESACEQDPLRYPKQHPGLLKMKPTPRIPKLVEKNARELLQEKGLINNKGFMKEVEVLKEKVRRRQPPLETKETEQKINYIASKLYQMEIEKLEKEADKLTEEQRQKVEDRVRFLTCKTYKVTTHNFKPMPYDNRNGLTYMGARLGANYRVLLQVFHEIQYRDPQFVPLQTLNVASGIGSAIWAANTIWRSAVQEYFCVDNNNKMSDLARRLIANDLKNPMNMSIKGVNFRQFIPSTKLEENRFPLVVSAYSLLEFPYREDRLDILRQLWDLTDTYLVLVEQGTNAGYQLLMDARKYLLKYGASDKSEEGHVFAPCMHDQACPKLQLHMQPCNYSVEYKNLMLERDYGQGTKPLTEVYSYLVMKKGPRPQYCKQDTPGVRITDIPDRRPTQITCQLCCPDGTLRKYIVTKTKPSPHLLRCLKKSSPGDFLPCHWDKSLASSPHYSRAQEGPYSGAGLLRATDDYTSDLEDDLGTNDWTAVDTETVDIGEDWGDDLVDNDHNISASGDTLSSIDDKNT